MGVGMTSKSSALKGRLLAFGLFLIWPLVIVFALIALLIAWPCVPFGQLKKTEDDFWSWHGWKE